MGITPVLFTSEEVAAALGVNRRTITRWVDTGRIKPAKKGAGAHGGYVFTGDEVARVGQLPRRRRRVVA